MAVSPDTYPEPVHGLRQWWIRYAGSLAVVLLILTTSFGFWKLEGYLDMLREGNLEGCSQANEARALERADARRSIRQTRAFDASILFPNTDPKYLGDLIAASIAQDRATIRVNMPVDCEARYPDTSVLTFPPLPTPH
jgi:hypothetical protein